MHSHPLLPFSNSTSDQQPDNGNETHVNAFLQGAAILTFRRHLWIFLCYFSHFPSPKWQL